jgi:hypothetical protein
MKACHKNPDYKRLVSKRLASKNPDYKRLAYKRLVSKKPDYKILDYKMLDYNSERAGRRYGLEAGGKAK